MKIKLALIASLLLAVIPAGAQVCGPDVKHSIKTVKGKSPLENSPPADKALVYALAPRQGGTTSQIKVSADRA